MKFLEQRIKDVFIIEPEPYIDDRGLFRRNFCQVEFRKNKIVDSIKQANVSENNFAYTLRGFHYQIPPFGEGKTLSCFRGSIYDVVVDLRPDSSTYLHWDSFELNASNRFSLHVPPGCANCFLTLENTSLIHYYCSEAYHPEAERGIRYNDPFFDFKFPANPKIISDKDRNFPAFDQDLHAKEFLS